MKLFKRDNSQGSGKTSASGIQKPVAAIRSGWITEKAGDLKKFNQYVFLADKTANKPQVKAAVEEKYKVKVTSVRIIRKEMRAKRRGSQYGRKTEIKKAIVTLAPGNSIDIMPS